MKKIKLVDILPSLFGALAIIGAVTSSTTNSFALNMFYTSGAATVITGLISVIGARTQHKLKKIHILNVIWVVLSILFFIMEYTALSHFKYTF